LRVTQKLLANYFWLLEVFRGLHRDYCIELLQLK
jgi:hypothetical protein